MLVMGLFAIVLAATLPFLGSFQQRQSTKTAGQELTEALRRAQHRSMTIQDNRSWGVNILSGSFVLYAGPSYVGRDGTADEVHAVASMTSITGLSDVHFDTRGVPSATGILSVTRSDAAVSEAVQVNAGGGIFLLKP